MNQIAIEEMFVSAIDKTQSMYIVDPSSFVLSTFKVICFEASALFFHKKRYTRNGHGAMVTPCYCKVNSS